MDFLFEVVYSATMLLKFGRKGHAHECIVRLSPDKKYIEWEGKLFKRKKKNERRGNYIIIESKYLLINIIR